jgi:hypothetical protein
MCGQVYARCPTTLREMREMARRGLPPGSSKNFDEKCLRGANSHIGYSVQPAILDIDKILAFFRWIGGSFRRIARR